MHFSRHFRDDERAAMSRLLSPRAIQPATSRSRAVNAAYLMPRVSHVAAMERLAVSRAMSIA
jgi:hypothetical protein